MSAELPRELMGLSKSVRASIGGLAAAGFLLYTSSALEALGPATPERIPTTTAAALDGRTVVLPRDLDGGVTVLILGFGRNSGDTTTAWEKPIRKSLAGPGIGFFDMPVLAEVPGFVRPFVLRAIRHKVPDVLKPNFVPVTESEADWKRVAGFDQKQPDAAYVLLVDRSGTVQWTTHEAYSADRFQAMAAEARKLAAGER